MSYVYIQSEPGLFTVGFYDPKGQWHTDADFSSREEARRRVAFLNGGSTAFLDQALNEGDGVYRP